VQYAAPLGVIVGLSLAALFGALLYLTWVQDEHDLARDRQILSSALGSRLEISVNDVQDYAIWDPAFQNLVLKTDREWPDANVAEYLGRIQGYTHVLVMVGGETVYAFSHGSRQKSLQPAQEILGPEFGRGLEQVKAMAPVETPVVGGFSRSADRTYIYSVARVLPLSAGLKGRPEPLAFIAIAREVSPWFLWQLGQTASLSGLRLVETAAGGLPLKGLDGSSLGAIEWPVRQSGAVLRNKILPVFLLVGLLATAAAALILARAQAQREALEELKSRAEHLASHDPLTGLPNRHFLFQTLGRLGKDGGPSALLYLDLDGFKGVNDVYGHDAGDILVRRVSQRLSEACGNNPVIRAGGDEFAVIVWDAAYAQQTAAEIARVMAEAVRVAGADLTVGASIGIAYWTDAITAEELVRRADVAMYAAKTAGRGVIREYAEAFDTLNQERRQLEADLSQAVLNDEIEVAYQPIVDANSEIIVGVEALARWRRHGSEDIPPHRFIAVAEQSGLIGSLGRGVLRRACTEALNWNCSLSVNVSPAQFWDERFVGIVEEILAGTGFPAERLDLEITEQHLIQGMADAASILARLKSLGISISLDDFGAGYASVGYLMSLPLDKLKLDRSISQKIGSRADGDIAQAIIGLAQSLGLKVVAEGVETRDQAVLLRIAGCSYLQGWLFGRPSKPAEMAARLARRDLVA
jgi:diguanylate cyclase (GGDEF)-like protein